MINADFPKFVIFKCSESENVCCSVLSDYLRPRGLARQTALSMGLF